MYKNYTFEYKRFTGMNGDLFFYFETKLLFSLEMVLKIYFIHFDFSQVGIILSACSRKWLTSLN